MNPTIETLLAELCDCVREQEVMKLTPDDAQALLDYIRAIEGLASDMSAAYRE